MAGVWATCRSGGSPLQTCKGYLREEKHTCTSNFCMLIKKKPVSLLFCAFFNSKRLQLHIGF